VLEFLALSDEKLFGLDYALLKPYFHKEQLLLRLLSKHFEQNFHLLGIFLCRPLSRLLNQQARIPFKGGQLIKVRGNIGLLNFIGSLALWTSVQELA
jgi:hypothetical protein